MTLPSGVERLHGSVVTTRDPELRAWLDARFRRVGIDKWIGPPLPLAARAASFARAAVGGLAEPSVYEARLKACEECPALERTGAAKHCGACGCGRSLVAELTNKAKLAGASCPLERW